MNLGPSQSAKKTPSDHRTASRVLDILELLAQEPSGLALWGLSARLDAPKSSLLPLLRTLAARSYITHDDNGIYRLGTKILELSSGLDMERGLRTLAHPELVALRDRTGESAILASLASDRRSVVYLDKVQSLHRIGATARVGEIRALHSTSSGRLLLANMPGAERETAIEAIELTRYTEKTISTKAALRREIEHILATGVCVNVDQSVLGHCAIAAPIRDHWGEVIAACVLSAPTDRVIDNLPALTDDTRAAAGRISASLGYREKVASATPARRT